MEQIKFVIRQIKGYRFKFILLFLFVVTASIIGTFYPFYLGRLVDSVLYQHDFHAFFMNFIFYGVVFSSHQIVWFFHTRLVERLRATFLVQIKKNALRRVLSYKAGSLTELASGDIIHRLNEDTNQIMDYIYYNVIYATSDVFELLAGLIFIFLINRNILLLTLVAMPVSFFFSAHFSKKVKSRYREVNKERNAFISWLFDVLNGLQDIKLLHAGHRIVRILVQKKTRVIRKDIEAKKIETAAESCISAVSFATRMILYICSALFIIFGHFTIGGFIAVIAYFNDSLSLFEDIFGRANPITQNLVAIDRVMELFLEETEQAETTVTHSIQGDIQFQNIAFSYQEDQVLKHVSFHIKKGEKVAIVGHSGSGKSTLINLLLRFYDVDEGEIYLDGNRISDYDIQALRNQIGVVQQSNALFQGTIRFNLQFSDEPKNDNLLWEALRYAELEDFVSSLPGGLDTRIGSSGIDISGGQRQRLTIARLYLKKPRILIFDEATSSLDSDTEKNVIDCLNRIYSEQTVIMISHRLSTILKADKILLLHNGKVEAVGTHEELLKDNTIYEQLFSSQMVGGETA